MKGHVGLLVLGAVVVVVGALAFGIPTSYLWIIAVLAICPLMMMFMMRGMHGGGDGAGHSRDAGHDVGSHRRDERPSRP